MCGYAGSPHAADGDGIREGCKEEKRDLLLVRL
jgi:hypothetical protein